MRKKITPAFVLVALGCVVAPGSAAYPRGRTIFKERILSKLPATLAIGEHDPFPCPQESPT